MAELTPDDVRTLTERAEGTYLSHMHQTFAEMESLYNLTYALGVTLPPDVREHRPSKAPAIVDTFSSQVRTLDWQVDLGPVRGSRTQQRADLLRAAGRTWLQRINDYEDEPTWDFVKFDLSLYGASAVRVLFDEDAWPDDPSERRQAWPFRTRAVHPKAVVVAPSFRWPYAYVVEHQVRSFGELRQDYPQWTPRKANGVVQNANKPDDVHDVYFFWDDEHYIGVAGGSLLFRKRNMLGIPPWVWGFSGLGHKAWDGDPDTQAVGVLRHAREEIVQQAILQTYAGAVWRYHALPVLKGTIPEDELQTKWSATAGKYIEMPADEHAMLEWMSPPEPNPAMWAKLPELDQNIERSTLADVLSGDPSGTRAASQFQAATGQARLKTDAVRRQLERMAGRVLAIIARYYERVLKHETEVEGKTLKPTDIKGFDQFRVSFLRLDPAFDSELKQQGLAAYQSNAISWRRYLTEYEQVPDADEEMMNKWEEDTISQLVQGGLLSEALLADLQQADRETAMEGAEEQERNRRHQLAGGVLGAPEGQQRPGPTGNRRPTASPGGEGPADAPRLPRGGL